MNNFIKHLAELRIRVGRGTTLFSDVKNALLIGASLKILLNTSTLGAFFLVILAFVGFFFIGWLDLSYLKLYQKEAQLSTEKYNPTFEGWNKKLRHGKTKV